MFKTEVEAGDIQHFTRDLANINALKNYIVPVRLYFIIPYSCSRVKPYIRAIKGSAVVKCIGQEQMYLS